MIINSFSEQTALQQPFSCTTMISVMTLPGSVPFERRSTHRYKIELPIELIMEDGTVLPVQACNISRNGMQFRCDSWVADEIEPRGIQTHLLDQIRLKAVADLPDTNGETSRMYARCKVVVARRLSQEEYILGVDFTDFESSSERLFQNYLRQCEEDYQKSSGEI